jgi:3D (Asp-Asp-Asp) domain-containing protein
MGSRKEELVKEAAAKKSISKDHLDTTRNLNKDEYICIITPNTDNARRLGYVKVNLKIIPLMTKVVLNKNDLKLIENMFEYQKTNGGIDVYEIMRQMRISQEKANKVAREMLKSGEKMNGKVNAVKIPMYNITILKKGS